tara:strand:- start:612 stop:1190 length:579 start_codon:yes stop_codon:yes gene_type:complete
MTVQGQKEDVQAFAKAVVDVEERDNELHNIPASIFDKLLPMPENGSKSMTNAEGEVIGSAFADPERDGEEYIDGWRWTVQNWGTKWGDCDTTFSNHGDSLEFFYQTAWSPATYTEISKMFPNLTFIIRYEEGGMCFLGCDVYQNGSISEYEGTYPEMTEGDYDDEDWEAHDLAIEDALTKCYQQAQDDLVSA